MAEMHKLTKNGETIYPATTTDSVVHPELQTSLTNLINEYNVSLLYPTGGIGGTDKYDLETAVAKLDSVLKSEQKTIGTKLAFMSNDGSLIEYEFIGTSFNNISSWIVIGYKTINELNISNLFPTSGIDSSNKYTLETAIAQVPAEYRSIQGLKITFINNTTGKTETWKYDGGTFTSTSSWKQGDGNGGNLILKWNTDAATTRKQVLQQERKSLLQISYENADGDIINEQYKGTTFTDTEWAKDSNWDKIPNQEDLSNINDTIQKQSDKVDYQENIIGIINKDAIYLISKLLEKAIFAEDVSANIASLNKALLKGSNKFSGVVIPYISLIDGKVTIESNTDVFYSVDGADPDTSDIQYTEPLSPTNSCVVKAVSCVGNVLSAVTRYFYSADNLEKITFADSVEGNSALEDLCLSLYDTNKDGTLQMSEVRAVLSIAGNAGFRTCQMDTFNELVEFENATIADSAFAGNTYIKEVTLPKNLKIVTSRAFSGCTSLQSVVMFDKVEEIQTDAFKGCSKLTNIVYSDKIKKIGLNAFMSTLITSLPDNLIEMGDYSCAYSTKISELPNTLQIIGNSAFEKAPISIQSIPDSVYKIGNRAFYQCPSINISKLPKNLIEIGDSAFSGCKEGVTISEIPLGLTSIPNNCFWDTKVTFKEIPASVKSIGSGAFYGSNIKKLKILSEELVTLGNTNAFPSTATFYVPDNLVESYKEAANWSSFSSKIFALSTYED